MYTQFCPNKLQQLVTKTTCMYFEPEDVPNMVSTVLVSCQQLQLRSSSTQLCWYLSCVHSLSQCLFQFGGAYNLSHYGNSMCCYSSDIRASTYPFQNTFTSALISWPAIQTRSQLELLWKQCSVSQAYKSLFAWHAHACARTPCRSQSDCSWYSVARIQETFRHLTKSQLCILPWTTYSSGPIFGSKVSIREGDVLLQFETSTLCVLMPAGYLVCGAHPLIMTSCLSCVQEMSLPNMLRISICSPLQVNLWVGRAGIVTHTHYDCTYNFFVQLQGRKRFTLFPPDQNLYLFPCLHPVSALFLVTLK